MINAFFDLERINIKKSDPTDSTSGAGFSPQESKIAFNNAVVKDNKDPDGLGRIKVQFTHWHEKTITDWIPVVRPYAGDSHGMFYLPEPGDEVICGFLHGNPQKPLALGTVHKKNKPDIGGKLGEALGKMARAMKKLVEEEGTKLAETSITTVIKSGTKLVSTLAKSKIKSLNLGKMAEFLKGLSEFANGLLGALAGGMPAMMQGAAAKAGVKDSDEDMSEEERLKNMGLSSAFKMAQEACTEVLTMVTDILSAFGEGDEDSSGENKSDSDNSENNNNPGSDNSESKNESSSSSSSSAGQEMAGQLAAGAKQAGMNVLNGAKDKAMSILNDLKGALVAIGHQLLAEMVLGDPQKNYTLISSKSGMRILMQEVPGMEQISLLMCPVGMGIFATMLRFITHTADIQIHLNKTLGTLITNDVGMIKFKCTNFNLNSLLPPIFLQQKGFNIHAKTITWKSIMTMMLAKKKINMDAASLTFYTRLVLAKGKMVATMLDLAVGVDTHNVEVPTQSGTRTVPLPHPYAGMLLDKLSNTVKVAFLPVAVKGSKSMFLIPGHIAMPPGIMFTKQPNNEGEITSGTEPSVKVNGKEVACMMSKVTTCNDIGLRDHCQIILGIGPSILTMIQGGSDSPDADGGGGAGDGAGDDGNGAGGAAGKINLKNIGKKVNTFMKHVQQVREICKEMGIPIDSWLSQLKIFTPILKMLYVSERFAPSMERCIVAYIYTSALNPVGNSGVFKVKDNSGNTILERPITLFDPIELSKYKSKAEVKERMIQMLREGTWDGKDGDGRYVSPTQSPFTISLQVKDMDNVIDKKKVKVEIDRIVTLVHDSIPYSVKRGAKSGEAATRAVEARIFLKSMFGFGMLTMVPLDVKFEFSKAVKWLSGSVGVGVNVSDKLKEKYKDNSSASLALEFAPEIKVGGSVENPFGDVTEGPLTEFTACTMAAIGPDMGNAKCFFSPPNEDIDIKAVVTGQGKESFLDVSNVKKGDIMKLAWEYTTGLQDLLVEGLDNAIGELEKALGIDIPIDGNFLLDKLKCLKAETIKEFINFLKNSKIDLKKVEFEKIDWKKFELEIKKRTNIPTWNNELPDIEFNWETMDWGGIMGVNYAFKTNEKQKYIQRVQWQKDGSRVNKAKFNEKVTLSAKMKNFIDGDSVVVKIYEKDYQGANDHVKTFNTTVGNESINLTWNVEYIEDNDDIGSGFQQKAKGYTLPEYIFEVQADGKKVKSGLLKLDNKLEIYVKDPDSDNPIKKVEFIIKANGEEVYRGKTDRLGKATVKQLKPGKYDIELLSDKFEFFDK